MLLSNLSFSKFKNKDFSKANGNYLQQINESELAFLCFYNKTIPRQFCPKNNWKYKRTAKETFVYTTVERIQYNIFLMLNGYSILPMSYFYGLLMSLTLFATKGIKDKSKSKSKADSQIKESKITSHFNYRTHINTKKVHKEDAKMLLTLFDDLHEKENFSWVELDNLPIFIEHETNALKNRKTTKKE